MSRVIELGNANNHNYNNNNEPREISPLLTEREEQLTFLCVLFSMIVIGNLLVVTAIALSPNRRSRMNIFMMNLAIADLSAGLVNVLTDIIWKSTVDWHAGYVGCKVIRYGQGVVTYASTYALVALSLDRLHAIARPLGFTSSTFRIRLLVCLAWVCALVFSIPMLIINETRSIDGRIGCLIEFPQPWIWKLYMTIIAVILFFIPAIIIAVCYIIIVVIIWSKSPLSVSESPSGSKRYIKNGGHIYEAANNRHFKDSATIGRGLIPKAKMKTIKMTLVIVLVFVICWSPYFVFDLLGVYGFISQTQNTVALSTFIQSLAPLNSAANPLIYASFNSTMCLNLCPRRGDGRRGGPNSSHPTPTPSYLTPSHQARVTRNGYQL